MRIAIAVESELVQRVAEHFGRCTGFCIYEIDKDNNLINEGITPNPLGAHGGGTCQLPHFVNTLNVDVIVAGGMGQKAIQLFQNYNIEVITAPGLEVNTIIEKYISGELKGYEECKDHSHEC